ncbi:hypothetical protein J6590_050315 [Homalodisca vitripennis]|nr:hypothetical protein J6590_050315 [Homalodisca vitripennis]
MDEGKILGSRHRHANDTNLHEKVSLAVFFNRRLGRGLLTCMKSQSRCVKTVPAEYENRLRKSVTFTASSRDLKVKPMSYNSATDVTLSKAATSAVTVFSHRRPENSFTETRGSSTSPFVVAITINTYKVIHRPECGTSTRDPSKS